MNATQELTLQALGDHIEAVTGVGLDRIKTLRVTAKHGRMDSPVWLEATTICRDDNGRPYMDAETEEVATEVRRFRIASLVLEAGE